MNDGSMPCEGIHPAYPTGREQRGMMTSGWRWKRNVTGMMTAALSAGLFVALAPRPGRAAVPPGEQLFQSNDCVTCHAIDHQVVGPSYIAVAKKFAGQKDAVPTLVSAIKNGHVGTWGVVPMPPHPNLTDAQIKEIVDWILTLK
ncbi:MAG TPA: c-type cytochrome [Acetobacteraceae bacterium]|nr:c-type cytochrome [Acetobacteraceae bacterium]